MSQLNFLQLKKNCGQITAKQHNIKSELASSGLGKLRLAGRMRHARPFYAAHGHLQKYELLP